MAELKRITCDPDCGFMIQSHDEKEVLEVSKKHSKNKHQMEVTDEDLMSKMESV